MKEKQKTKIRKLTKDEIIEYYHRISHPHLYNLDYVPVEMQVKAFEKLLNWQEIPMPEQVKDEKKLSKMTFQIVCNND